MTERFSQRGGYGQDVPEITVREEAPFELRAILERFAVDSGLRHGELLDLVCDVLMTVRDDFKNITENLRDKLRQCEWFYIYDVIEEVHRTLHEKSRNAEDFTRKVNAYFRKNGVGWQLIDGRVESRGSEVFEDLGRKALSQLEPENKTASVQLHEALTDLSRRPEVDATGAVQHAIAALECVAREITGDRNSTLGKIIRDNPNLLPTPLDQAVEKLWGYTSEQGRHLRESASPGYEEAEITVSLSAAICTYLIRKKQLA